MALIYLTHQSATPSLPPWEGGSEGGGENLRDVSSKLMPF